jgi:hypothetical protein
MGLQVGARDTAAIDAGVLPVTADHSLESSLQNLVHFPPLIYKEVRIFFLLLGGSESQFFSRLNSYIYLYRSEKNLVLKFHSGMFMKLCMVRWFFLLRRSVW